MTAPTWTELQRQPAEVLEQLKIILCGPAETHPLALSSAWNALDDSHRRGMLDTARHHAAGEPCLCGWPGCPMSREPRP